MNKEIIKTAMKDWAIQLIYGFAFMHIIIGIAYLLTVAGVDVIGYLDYLFNINRNL